MLLTRCTVLANALARENFRKERGKKFVEMLVLVVKNIDFNKLDLAQKLEILFKNSYPEFLAVFSKHVLHV